MAETNKKKRVVKDPETFRERAQKATVASDKPKASHKAKSGILKVLTPIFRPIWKLLKLVFNRQPFKFIGKILKIIGRVIVPSYIRNSWKELRLVTWPSFTLSRKLTFAVIIFAIVFGAAIAGVDWVLNRIFKEILLK